MIEEYLNRILAEYEDLKSHSDFLESENRKLEQKEKLLKKWLKDSIKQEEKENGIIMSVKEEIYQDVLEQIIKIDDEVR